MTTNLASVDSFRFFDPEADFGVVERMLPRWMQAKTVCFITWRTWDSMPAHVVKEWHDERTAWLRRHRIDARAANLRNLVRQLSEELRREYHQLFSERWETLLDNGHDACPLRSTDAARIVSASLTHFDNVRYLMTDFVVM